MEKTGNNSDSMEIYRDKKNTNFLPMLNILVFRLSSGHGSN